MKALGISTFGAFLGKTAVASALLLSVAFGSTMALKASTKFLSFDAVANRISLKAASLSVQRGWKAADKNMAGRLTAGKSSLVVKTPTTASANFPKTVVIKPARWNN